MPARAAISSMLSPSARRALSHSRSRYAGAPFTENAGASERQVTPPRSERRSPVASAKVSHPRSVRQRWSLDIFSEYPFSSVTWNTGFTPLSHTSATLV